MAARTTVIVPDLGDFHDVEVIDVLVKPGDTVAVTILRGEQKLELKVTLWIGQ